MHIDDVISELRKRFIASSDEIARLALHTDDMKAAHTEHGKSLAYGDMIIFLNQERSKTNG